MKGRLDISRFKGKLTLSMVDMRDFLEQRAAEMVAEPQAQAQGQAMTPFHDMTRIELEEAIAAEVRDFIMADIEAQPNTAEFRSQLLRYTLDTDRHFEFMTHPPTEAERAERRSGRFEVRAKTAWGHMELVRQGYAEVPR